MRCPRVLALALALAGGGCHAFWPAMVRPAPEDPVFRSGFPLVGPMRTDGALCSLASVGPETTRLVRPPEPVRGAMTLRQACGPGAPLRPGQLVEVDTAHGLVHGHLHREADATGLAVIFSGLGMPPDGWINSAFAGRAARRGLASFAPVRDESPRPIVLDPLREARRGLAAAVRIREVCGLDPGSGLFFLGISLGGLEALLANREALGAGRAARAAVLDPVLDVERATGHLDSFWHSLAADSMQDYFRRILRGRYGEPEGTGFREVMRRIDRHPGAMTRLAADSPRAWLCAAPRAPYAIFLSDTDPVLGDDQREFALDCGFPFRKAGVPGHTPLACRLEILDEMLDSFRPASPVLAGW